MCAVTDWCNNSRLLIPSADSCADIACPSSKFCAQDQNGRPHCIKCNLRCKKNVKIALVCGSDGQTYKSKCHMQEAACAAGKAISAQRDGTCANGMSLAAPTAMPPQHSVGSR